MSPAIFGCICEGQGERGHTCNQRRLRGQIHGDRRGRGGLGQSRTRRALPPASIRSTIPSLLSLAPGISEYPRAGFVAHLDAGRSHTLHHGPHGGALPKESWGFRRLPAFATSLFSSLQGKRAPTPPTLPIRHLTEAAGRCPFPQIFTFKVILPLELIHGFQNLTELGSGPVFENPDG